MVPLYSWLKYPAKKLPESVQDLNKLKAPFGMESDLFWVSWASLCWVGAASYRHKALDNIADLYYSGTTLVTPTK